MYLCVCVCIYIYISISISILCVCIHTCTHTEIFGHKKVTLSLTAWVDLEDIMLSQISQMEKEKKHHMIHSCVGYEIKKKRTRQTHRCRQQRRTGAGEGKLGKGGPMCGNRRQLGFGC